MEAFPVGRSLAYDAWKGRLWAVCGRCRRWNLAPIEERWEAVEELERSFRGSRLRAHSENVGLAKMPDGTRLIRVGEAVPLELATWRYGDALRRNRRKALLGSAAGLVGGTALLVAGTPLLAMGAAPAAIGYVASQALGNLLLLRQTFRPVLRIPADQSPTGERLVIRQQTSYHARLVPSEDESGLAVELPSVLPLERVESGGVVRWVSPPPLRIEGELASRFLERTLVSANVWSSGRGRLEAAMRRLEESGGPEPLMRSLAERGGGFYPAWLMSNANTQQPSLRGGFSRLAGSFRGERIAGYRFKPPRPLPREEVVALEIALHEEAERRALAGELAGLEAAWREAEEIADIADRLPDDPLDTLPDRGRAE